MASESIDGTLDLDRGRRLGKYEILTRLSIGGMAELFLAVIAGPGGFKKFVALKRILSEYRDDEDFVRMFLDEARITAALSHSNIAQVFDLGQEDGEYYLALEFIAGVDVARVLKTVTKRAATLPVGMTCAVVRDTCLALNAAHTYTDPMGKPLPIVHRDISPKNVMITYAGSIKVIDFGIAKAHGAMGKTRAGTVKGSVGYMSPEQIRGDELDGRSDLFSAAIMLHEMLVNRRLFTTPDDHLTMQRILNEPIKSPREMNPAVTPALEEVVMHALNRDPKQRYSNGKEFAKALEQASKGMLFDEELTSNFMREHFKDRIDKTRAILEMANSVSSEEKLRAAAGALKDDAGRASREVSKADALRPAGVDVDREGATRPTNRPFGPQDASKVVASEASGARPGPAPSPANAESPASILVVDDTAVGRKVVEHYLGQEGYRVVSCASAAEALEMLEQMRPDLMISDVRMPGMDGFELCAKLRANQDLRLMPILFLSAACSLEERVKGLSVGGDDFIRKPYEPAELAARVRMHLQRVAMLKAAPAAN